MVRFPYWVQLDITTLAHHFGLEAEIDRSFPHGFIATKLYPEHFAGLELSASGPNCLASQRSSAML